MKAENFHDEYVFISDSQDIAAVLEYVPQRHADGVTGAFVLIDDGGYSEIWVTRSSRPYLADTPYERVVPAEERIDANSD